MRPPHLALYDDTPIYNTRAAVKLTQVEAPRLRAWERRYAILSPHRSSNSYRLYSERDLAIIRWLRDQVAAGMTISQATSYLKIAAVEHAAAPAVVTRPTLQLSEMAPTLVTAAQRLDEAGATQLLRQSFAVYAVEEVCEELIQPALSAIGQEWSAGRDVIAAEHFLAHIARAQLDAVWRLAYQADSGPRVLVACAPGEQHELGALMLALFLRRRGVRVTYLGQNMDAPSLVRAVQEIGPAAVCLSATLAENHAPLVELARTVRMIPDVQVFIGGQALQTVPTRNGYALPAGITALYEPGSVAATIIKRSICVS
jgi:DNA-binding transcriptional MerR regulator/methylmalonyl-CoA mutase cobalamin-binding subunit